MTSSLLSPARRLRLSRRLRQFNLSLVATLALMAVTACGGGSDAQGPGTTAANAATAMPTAGSTSPLARPAGLLQEDGTPMPTPDSPEWQAAADAAKAESAGAQDAGGKNHGKESPSALAQASAVAAGPVSFVNSDGLTIPARLYLPAGASGPLPTVVMMHGCSGVYSYSDPSLGVALIHKEWAQRLNAAGYAALLVDSFSPRGTQNQCGNGVEGVNEAVDRPKDARAALAWLVASGVAPADRIALLGWSNGASATLASLDVTHGAAGQPRFAGGLAFYPGCGLLNNFGGIAASSWKPYAPLSIFHGQIDPLYTDGYCATRVNRAQTAGATGLSMTVYTGARHSFDQATSVKSPYTQSDVDAKQAADAAAMSRLAAWLAS